MKHLYLLCTLAATMFINSVSAQCTPDQNVSTGFSPTSSNVPCVNKGQAFSQTFTFVIPSTVGGFATVTSVTFDSIRNLPSGLTGQFNQNPPTYAGGDRGCLLVSGTTNDACGQYKVLLYVTVNTNLFPVSGELSALSAQYGLTGFDPLYLRVKDAAGTCPAVNANNQNFTADQSCGIAGSVASATTTAATNLTLNGATLNGVVNANGSSTTVTFEYGLTTSYGTSVAASPGTVTGNSNTNVAAAISGLLSNTTYHYRVKAVNGSGTSNGNDMTFTTLAPAGACTPNTNQTTAFEPAPADFQCVIKGSPFSETIFLNFAAVNASVPFDSVRIDSLGNMPLGIVGLTNQSDKTYKNNEFGCIQFSGTTAAACGQYKIKMYITMWGTLAGTISGELTTLAAQFGLTTIPTYYNRVASCAGACPDLDATAGDFEPNTNCPTPGVIAAPNISGATSFCTGGSTTLTASPGYIGYKWSNNVLNQSITVTTANTYTVTVSNGCDTSTASVTVTSNPAPNTAVSQTGNTLSVPNDANASYQWLNNGAPINNATSSSYTPTATGNYSVDVTLGSCRDTSNAIQVTISSVESVAGITTINVVPNPAKSYVTVELKAQELINELKVMDMFGQLLKEIAVNSNSVKEKINVEDLPAGIYFLQIGTTKGKVTHSFMKQ